MSKTRLIMEIVTLLQGTPVDEFARQNLFVDGNTVVVKCALTTTVESPAGLLCKQSIATALRRYSYRFTTTQITVLADLYATALERLEPEAVPAVRKHMCDPTSEESRRDPVAALAVCERLSSDS